MKVKLRGEGADKVDAKRPQQKLRYESCLSHRWVEENASRSAARAAVETAIASTAKFRKVYNIGQRAVRFLG